MIFDKKGLKGNNFVHLILAAILILGLVFVMNFMTAVPVQLWGFQGFNTTVNYSAVVLSNNTPNEDALYNFSILINTTLLKDGLAYNITKINITLPAEIIFQNNSNRTSGNLSVNAEGVHTNLDINLRFNYTTDRKQLTWSNGTAGTAVIPGGNNTYNNSIIAFNFTAYTPGRYNISVTIYYNGTALAGAQDPHLTFNSTNITIWVNDTTRPWNVNVTTVDKINASRNANNVSGSVEINLSAFDNGNHTYGARGYDVNSVVVQVWNQTDTTNGINATYVLSNVTGQYWNFTLPTTKFPDGNYTLVVAVNDTNGNVNRTTNISIKIDNTAPTGSATCTPSTVNLGDTVTCSCSVTDATSGENSSVTSITGSPSTTSTGTFTQTCSFADLAGNSGTTTAQYTVEQGGSGAGAGTGTSGSATGGTVAKAQTFTKITPGVASIVKNFDAETGLKEIQIEVKNEAQNVKVSVTKYTSKPAAVSVEKAGKVFQYMQIKVDNVADKLEKAKISTKVKKTWISDNALTKEKVALFKFDETVGKWNELTTTYASEDDTYYYYDAEVASFSYFAIGERGVVEATTPSGTGTTPSEDTTTGTAGGTNLTWLWIVIGVVVLAGIAWFVWSKRK